MSDRELKVMVVKILTQLEKRMKDLSEIFNKEIENIKKNQQEMKDLIVESKNTFEGISR